MSSSSKQKFALVLVTGITVPGLLVYWLSSIGASQLGEIVWALGYGTTILVIWYVWIRPIEFGLTGPDANGGDMWKMTREKSETDNHHLAERADHQYDTTDERE